ncbi:MAG: hypothetical protein CVT77_16350, partial [Alphaproteobacteria bacterium HGW-Alphaproteobacteria-16]
PLLALVPFGIWTLLRDPERRDLGWLVIGGAAVAFLYQSAYVYWDGGHATGPRHALPAMAYLAVALAAFHASARGVERWLGFGFLGVSIAINLMIASAEITAPDTFAKPLTEHVWPKFARGDLRTLPSEFWGWSQWSGLYLYLAVAGVLAVALLFALRREQAHAR